MLPPGVDLSAYRIVQEADQRVSHGPAHARVTVRYAAAQIELEIYDDGSGLTSPDRRRRPRPRRRENESPSSARARSVPRVGRVFACADAPVRPATMMSARRRRGRPALVRVGLTRYRGLGQTSRSSPRQRMEHKQSRRSASARRCSDGHPCRYGRLEATSDRRSKRHPTRVLVLTTLRPERMRPRALHAGAGFRSKTLARRTARRRPTSPAATPPLAPAITRAVIQIRAPSPTPEQPPTKLERLTAREQSCTCSRGPSEMRDR